MTNLRHYDNLGTARFVTFSCYHRYQLLNDNLIKDIFIKHLGTVSIKYDLAILGYVLMPEHVHLVIYPRKTIALGNVIGELKSRSAREILLLLRRQDGTLLKALAIGHRHQFWQRRCYDHNCRSTETVKEKIVYCHNNPVTRGLVSSPEQWKYSSYRWYEGWADMVLEIDGVDL